MTDQIQNVLILCTGNSARSILGEVLINHWGQGRFAGYSAGSTPKGAVHPLALELLQRQGLPTVGLRSKSWDEFAQPGAPPLDFVFTVCDNAAGESCPYWPGKPVSAHWGIEDPAAVIGSLADQQRAFRKAFRELEIRIRAFTSLPVHSMHPAQLKASLDEIGRLPASDDVV
jgi:arsenate reductase (thioredoxin)